MNKIAIPKTFETLYVCGDIHGEFDTFIYNLKRCNIENAVVIVAGDCGFGFEKEEHYTNIYNTMQKSLSKLNILVLMLRGNHDDPSYFNGERINFNRLKCLEDYTVVTFKELNILCVGGGISVDRLRRLSEMEYSRIVKHKDISLYWADEDIVFNPTALAEIKSNKVVINTIITHSAPTQCFPTSKAGITSWLERDKNLEADLNAERSKLDNLLQQLLQDNHNITDWYYGHYHDSKIESIDGINYHLLNVMEFKECRN